MRDQGDVALVLSPEEFESAKNPDGFEITPTDVHDPREEAAPEHAYFQLELSRLHNDIDASLRDLWIALQGFEDDDLEMENQRKVTQQGRRIGAPKPLVVTTVGPAGVGKSFLYKALFNRPSITKSSAEGRSCTLYPTKIELRHDMPDDAKSSDVDIDFFSADTIAAMTEAHIRRYHDYHFASESDPADDDTRRYASTAEDFFKAAVSLDGGKEFTDLLDSLLSIEKIGDGALFRACIDAIENHISSLGASRSRKLSYLQVEDDSIEQVQAVADTLAPFVDFFVIKTGNALLRAGLTFIDLPGK